jgi:inositol hexakisphosphate/diphosphoinositol-pentakisphosphate kinase
VQWHSNKQFSVKLPKSFVAIDLSQDSSDRRSTASGKNKENGDAKSEEGERGRSEDRKDETELPIAAHGNVATPTTTFELEERKDGTQPAGLPPPALDA